MLRAEQQGVDVQGGEEEEEEEEEGDDLLFNSQHECPLVQQKVNKYARCSSSIFFFVNC